MPITPDKLQEAGELTEALEQFHIIVDNPVQFDAIEAHGAPCEGKVGGLCELCLYQWALSRLAR